MKEVKIENQTVKKFDLENLSHMNACERFTNIILCLERGYATQEEIEALKELSEHDDIRILGNRVGSFATAVLDLLGVEKYTGTDFEALHWIQELPVGVPIISIDD